MSSHIRSVRAQRGSRFYLATLAVAAAGSILAGRAEGQSAGAVSALDSTILSALATSPRIRAAESRVRSAQARVGPAGLRADPMLMVGIQDFPAFKPGFGDEMTMKMVGVTQVIPRGGKLAAARTVAEAEVRVANEALRGATLEVRRDVRLAGFEAAYGDRALMVIERNRSALVDLISAAEIRFGTGTAAGAPAGMGGAAAPSSGLADILRARVEAAKLGEQAAMLREQRRAAIGAVNALLNRSADFPVAVDIPASLERAAVAATTGEVRFESAVLGSRAAGSPLLSVDSLQKLARLNSAEVRMRSAMTAVQAARLELVARERRPDIEASLQYGQRDAYPDMLTATVSMPLLLRRKQRQDQYALAERVDLDAAEADRADVITRLNAEVARLHAMAERSRTQLALYKTAMIPQAQLGVDAAMVAFKSGTGSLRAVLDAQTMVFNAEIAYHQALLEFARTIAELERVVGAEVLQ